MTVSWTRLAALRRKVPAQGTGRLISRCLGTDTDRRTAKHEQLRTFSGVRSDVKIDSIASSYFSDILGASLWWAAPKKGTGFDNFLPKDKTDSEKGAAGGEPDSKKDDLNEAPKNEQKPSEKEEGTSSAPDMSSFKARFEKMRKEQGSGSSGGGSGGDNEPNNFAGIALTTALLMAFLYLMRSEPDEDSFASDPFFSREIHWQDFCTHLLETDQVEKIVVTSNRTTARVYLKPGAAGLPGYSRYSDRRLNIPGSNSEMSSTTMSTDGITSSSSEAGSMLPISRGGPKQVVYRLSIGNVDAFEKKLMEAQRAVGIDDPSKEIPVQYATESEISKELVNVLPSLVIMAIIFFSVRSVSGMLGGGAVGQGRGGGAGGIFQVGKSTAKKVSKEEVSVSFKDVAGCNEAKKEVMEFVDFLQDPSRFTKLGAKIPKGALLCGPPGTGKTLLAKAVAGEAGVPFYSISGSDFIEMFVGVGPARVRDLFKDARENSPCIVFIDEIDAVGRQRGRGGAGGNDERENTLNQLLVEMDGFEASTGVVVLAGTNRVDILDQALTRPGRFDRQITVDKPDLEGRKEIFQVHLKGITLEDSIEDISGRLAGLTPGFAGADIANICNEAAIVAARREAETVSMDDFEKATDRIIGGLESNKIMSDDERSIVAYHEAGHAIAGWFLKHADPLLKVTIIPRSSGALGFAQYLPKEVFLRTQEQIMDIVCMALAGRAAEEIFFGRVTTGASDDLRRVTDLVYSTIQLYGMNERLGQLAFPKDPNAMWDERPYSEKTAKAMDEEAKEIVDTAYQSTLDLLTEHKDAVEAVAKLLKEKETITHDDIVELVGPRPFKTDSAYEQFIRRRQEVKEELTGTKGGSDDDKGEGTPLSPQPV